MPQNMGTQQLTPVMGYFEFVNTRIIAIGGVLLFKDLFYFGSDVIMRTLPLEENDFLREAWIQNERVAGVTVVC